MNVQAIGPVLLTAIMTLTGLAGCLGGGTPELDVDDAAAWPRGVHPWPAGDEWPSDIVGNLSFELKELVGARIPSFDGVELETWILLPDVPEGVKVPVVLWSAPYFGQTYQPGNDPSLWDNSGLAEAVPVNLLVENGYAVAIMTLRGSSTSGGCFQLFGYKDWLDNAAAVEWLAAQPWSNGRVGMMGLSYHGTTPWQAAALNTPSLKTIVVAGMIGDTYEFFFTPQGAPLTIGAAFSTVVTAADSPVPVLSKPDQTAQNYPFVAPERVCPEIAQVLTENYKSQYTDIRDPGFWAERRMMDYFPDVTASVLLTHGFQDNYGSGHAFQEDPVWHTLDKAPKSMLEGHWGHEFPNFNSYNEEWVIEDWNQQAVDWLDFWLKGIGDPPERLGKVDYQDKSGAWHRSTAWPPDEAQDEVVYLSPDGTLSPEPTAGTAGFISAPHPDGARGAVCQSGPLARGQMFVTDPATTDTLVAGNPMVYLNLEANLPGGLVEVQLFEVEGEPSCGQNGLTGAERWSFGAADLRFHAGNMAGRNFPIGQATAVRIDMTSLADVLDAGNRLVLTVSYGDPSHHSLGPEWSATSLTVHGGTGTDASHIVLPIVNGTFGGDGPSLDYPPRPFGPMR